MIETLGMLPVIRSKELVDYYIKSLPGENLKVFIDALPYCKLPYPPGFTKLEEFKTKVYRPYLDYLWMGKKTAEEVIKLIVPAANKLLQEE